MYLLTDLFVKIEGIVFLKVLQISIYLKLKMINQLFTKTTENFSTMFPQTIFIHLQEFQNIFSIKTTNTQIILFNKCIYVRYYYILLFLNSKLCEQSRHLNVSVHRKYYFFNAMVNTE